MAEITKNILEKSEFYELPNSYNKTSIYLLAQTPKVLFIYWEVAKQDKEDLITKYGTDFFEKTTPVLLIHNITNNYSFEVEINDFTSNWYLSVSDSSCNFNVELTRRFKNKLICIAKSNQLELPNDHILIENSNKKIQFMDVKTNSIFTKTVQHNYSNEICEIHKEEILANPSSF